MENVNHDKRSRTEFKGEEYSEGPRVVKRSMKIEGEGDTEDRLRWSGLKQDL